MTPQHGTFSPAPDFTTSVRAAMRTIASTVHIVTTMDRDVPVGMAATAVTSLSFDPPSILICINQQASIESKLRIGSSFGLNILHRRQAELVAYFSNSDQRHLRFAGNDWTFDSGVPLLRGAQATLRCTLAARHVFGSHAIVIGAIEKAQPGSEADPLVYFGGEFCRLLRPDPDR